MKNVDLPSLVFIVIGAIMVYGAKRIFKVLKIKADDTKILVLKLIGLVIAFVGFFRILDII